MLDLVSSDISKLPSVALEDKHLLPASAGVYIAIDLEGSVQYIGRANGKLGVLGRVHNHNYLDRFRSIEGCRIAYVLISDRSLIPEIEKGLIKHFDPPLNTIWTTKAVHSRSDKDKKKPILAYLDEFEREKLERLAAQWGCSLSAAIKRLIREKSEGD